MAERIYPSTKPAAATNGAIRPPPGGASAFPAAKSQTYAANRPVYRPMPPRPRRRRRSCCCSLCLWLTLLIFALIFLAAIAGGIFYVLYRPHRPSFSVTTLRLSAFNLTASNALSSKLDLSVTAKNPNKKLVYIYDPITISVSSSGAGIGDGSFPGFVHEAGNTTVLKTAVVGSGTALDAAAAADLKKRTELPLEIRLETRAGVKVGGAKSKKIGIRVTCSGINVAVPKGKAPPSGLAPTSDVSCKVKVRVKVWKWYL